MTFNEQNTVEYFNIHDLTVVNLNALHGNVVAYNRVKWKCIQANLMQRDIAEVFLAKELKEALCLRNTAIAANPNRTEEVFINSVPYSLP